MDDRSVLKVKRVIWASMFLILAFIIIYNIIEPWIPVLLAGVLIFLITINNIIIFPARKNTSKIIIYIGIILVFFLNYYDDSNISQTFYLVLIAEACLDSSYLFCGSVTAFSFLSNLFNIYLQFDVFSPSGFIHTIMISLLMFLVFFGVICFAKFEINQRRTISTIMYELKKKTKQLEDSYIKLRDNTRDIEEITILKERNKIAREIHDTMGHTLTSVLIELEAGERLLKNDQDLAVQKINLAKEQVRKGLSNIRESVGVLNKGKEILGFVPSLKLLLEETALHGDIYVKYKIEELPQLSEIQENALYRALQEGLTNGIKHGKSTAFIFILKCEDGHISFQLQDNGIGGDKIIFGFGLSAMELRIREVGGTLNIDSFFGDGCTINISIPLVGREVCNGYQNSDCR
ncbi:MAG: signal transduction histidine kinase [Herbinix sp.]|nr:signal transduction histidine kinase [Herbinix sp.]